MLYDLYIGILWIFGYLDILDMLDILIFEYVGGFYISIFGAFDMCDILIFWRFG